MDADDDPIGALEAGWRGACARDDARLAQLLLEKAGARPLHLVAASGQSLACEAAGLGAWRTLEMLLRRDPACAGACAGGAPALWAARAWKGGPECLRVLAAFGADLGGRDGEGAAAAHEALASGEPQRIWETLAELGAPLDAGLSEGGRTALMEASRMGMAAEIRSLLSLGASVRKKDDGGREALHWACQAGWLGAARALLEAGADARARDYWGACALDAWLDAPRRGSALDVLDGAELLWEAGARPLRGEGGALAFGKKNQAFWLSYFERKELAELEPAIRVRAGARL